MSVPSEAKLALQWFFFGNFVIFLYCILILYTRNGLNGTEQMGAYYFMAVIVFAVFTFGFVFFRYWRRYTQRMISLQSSFLGLIFGCGVILSLGILPQAAFGWYLCVLSFFHFSEFFFTALYNYESLTIESFLLNHSVAYAVAASASWLEFFIELYLFPVLKFWPLSLIGLAMCLGGEMMRKVAMLTAGRNFNHYIQFTKADDHRLVTHGVYGWSRHPSYVGWFYWSVGTQILLCNPICFIAYTYASWRFFKERVEDEEGTLLQFFGEEYMKYQRQVGTKLPFIQGYRYEH